MQQSCFAWHTPVCSLERQSMLTGTDSSVPHLPSMGVQQLPAAHAGRGLHTPALFTMVVAGGPRAWVLQQAAAVCVEGCVWALVVLALAVDGTSLWLHGSFRLRPLEAWCTLTTPYGLWCTYIAAVAVAQQAWTIAQRVVTWLHTSARARAVVASSATAGTDVEQRNLPQVR